MSKGKVKIKDSSQKCAALIKSHTKGENILNFLIKQFQNYGVFFRNITSQLILNINMQNIIFLN